MRPVRLAVLVLALLAPAGCDFSSSEPDAPPEQKERGGLYSYDGRVIRGWLLALERQDYEQAAYYFAPGALIDQGRPYRLRTPEEAIGFNASLPCRADLVRLKGGGAHVLATFSLRAGPGGDCTGLVRVRYTIRKGKFTEWRQLPDAPLSLPSWAEARPAKQQEPARRRAGMRPWTLRASPGCARPGGRG